MSKVFYPAGKSKKLILTAIPVKLFYIFSFTLLLITPLGAFSQSVTLKGFGDPGKEWNRNPPVQYSSQPSSALFESVSGFMGSFGYYHCRVDSISFSESQVTIWGERGPVSVIGRVFFSNTLPVSPPDFGKLVTGQVFSQSETESYLIRLLSASTEAGFPFMTFRPEFRFLQSGKDTITVDIRIESGDTARVRLNGIIADGNREVSLDVIKKISRIKPDMVFSPEAASAIRSRLLSSELFKSVTDPTFQIAGENDYRWYVKVEEKPSSRFDGILGYSPATPTKPSTLNGLIDIRLKNFLGNARRLDLFWAREDEWSQEYRLNLTEPWILGFPIDFRFSAGQLNQDSSFIRQQFSGGIDFFGVDNWSFAVGYESGFTTGLKNKTTQITGPKVFNSEKQVFLTGITYDDRKGKSPVTNGHILSADVGLGQKRITGPDSILSISVVNRKTTWLEVNALLSVWKPVANRLIWFGSLKANHRSLTDPEISDLIRTGGINSLRGYRENQFLAIRQAIFSNELRLPFEDNSYLLAFADVGYLVTPAISAAGLKRAEQTLYGSGLGLMISTPVGLTRFLFALGKGDTFSTGKIHLGLINEF